MLNTVLQEDQQNGDISLVTDELSTQKAAPEPQHDSGALNKFHSPPASGPATPGKAVQTNRVPAYFSDGETRPEGVVLSLHGTSHIDGIHSICTKWVVPTPPDSRGHQESVLTLLWQVHLKTFPLTSTCGRFQQCELMHLCGVQRLSRPRRQASARSPPATLPAQVHSRYASAVFIHLASSHSVNICLSSFGNNCL